MPNTYTPNYNIDYWSPSKGDLCSMLYDIAEYLHNNPTWSTEEMNDFINEYFEDHPINSPVTSVAGKTGAVTLNTGDITAGSDTLANVITNIWTQHAAQDAVIATKYSDANPPPYPVTSVNGQTGAVVIEGGSSSPVQSVCGKTGVVTLSTEDIQAGNETLTSALSNVWTQHSAQDAVIATKYSAVNPPPYPVTSVNGMTGAVQIQAGSGSDVAVLRSGISQGQTLNFEKGINSFVFNFTHNFSDETEAKYKLFDINRGLVCMVHFTPYDLTGDALACVETNTVYLKIKRGVNANMYVGGMLTVITTEQASTSFVFQLYTNSGD